MGVYSFETALNWAINNINLGSLEEYRRSFDENSNNFSEYIRGIISTGLEGDYSQEDVEDLILDDYEEILSRTSYSDNTYIYTMCYIASKYLESHRNEIPSLREKVKEANFKIEEGEKYTDDYQRNILMALWVMDREFQESIVDQIEVLKANNPDYKRVMDSIEGLPKDQAFKKFVQSYKSSSQYSFMDIRNTILGGYYAIYGIEGSDPSNKEIEAIKKKYQIKEYVSDYIKRVESNFKKELIQSIHSMIEQLDYMGEIDNSVERHNRRTCKFRLPGLQYKSQFFGDKEEPTNGSELERVSYEYEKQSPTFKLLFQDMILNKLSIDALLRLNSFYNNRFAKVIEDYAEFLYMIEYSGKLKDIIDGKSPTSQDINQDVFENIVLKYHTLSIAMRQFYDTIHSESVVGQGKYHSEIKVDDYTQKEYISYDVVQYADELRKLWGKRFEQYFNSRIPGEERQIRPDVVFSSRLYNPIYITYQNKDDSMKAYYAYLDYISKLPNAKFENFGIVLDSANYSDGKFALLAFEDGKTNETKPLNAINSLHINRNSLRDFLVAFTGQPMIRVFEGNEEYYYNDDIYIATYLLAPSAEEHTKYLKQLVNSNKGESAKKLKPKDKLPEFDTFSRLHAGNKAYVDRLRFIQGTITTTPKVADLIKYGPRFYNLDDDQIYHIDKKTGEFVLGDGRDEKDSR